MQHFADDDSGYLSWLADHPEGFVLNTTQTPSARVAELPSGGSLPALSRTEAPTDPLRSRYDR